MLRRRPSPASGARHRSAVFQLMAFIKGFPSVSSTPVTILFSFYRRPERLPAGLRRAVVFRLGAADFIGFFTALRLAGAFGLEGVLALEAALARAGPAAARGLAADFRAAVLGALVLSRIASIVRATWSIEAMPSRLESLPLRA